MSIAVTYSTQSTSLLDANYNRTSGRLYITQWPTFYRYYRKIDKYNKTHC